MTSRPHHLKKTGSIKSKRRDLHHTWLHRETNEKLSFYYGRFVVIIKLQSSLVTFCLFIACPSNCVMHLWPKITQWSLLVVKGLKSSLLYYSQVRRAKLTVGEECWLIYSQWFHATYEAEPSTHMLFSFS